MDFRSTCVFSVKERITARISQLAGLSVAGHTITHSVETRTKTRWPVMWWFTRQWVMSRYLVCAISPPLLYYLPKIHGGYFPNSPLMWNVILLISEIILSWTFQVHNFKHQTSINLLIKSGLLGHLRTRNWKESRQNEIALEYHDSHWDSLHTFQNQHLQNSW
jgi:hypothetical protein